MRKAATIIAILVGIGLTGACSGQSGEPNQTNVVSTTPIAQVTPSSGTPERPTASNSVTTSMSQPTETAASPASESETVISIPTNLGLPVDSLPLMPGATYKTEDMGTDGVSFNIKNDGKSGKEIADWYYANLPAAGFDLANVQYNNGGFMYEGNGIKGDSLSTTSSFIIGMSLAN